MSYSPVLTTIVIFIVAIILIVWVIKNVSNKRVVNAVIPEKGEIIKTLNHYVSFFKQLDAADQETFIQRVEYFLHTTKITAEKGAIINNQHKVLVAASATIPLFHFKYWSYENLDEVLIYPGLFNETYDTEESHRNILGMVGDGAMHRKMILSLPALIAGFTQKSGNNTAIHEFVHLIDKADGDVDGVPEYLIPKGLVEPWLKEMHNTISQIRRDQSDIRDYAATNQAEFLAVVSEYFFQKPKALEKDHPELFQLLDEIYGEKKASA